MLPDPHAARYVTVILNRSTKGEKVLLIQSGAIIPARKIIEEMEKYFTVSVFSGVPEKEKQQDDNYALSLRYAAAKARTDKIVTYWGLIESTTDQLITKTVSWVPIVGLAIPDQAQAIRIRLKAALIDVRIGTWEIFSPNSFEDLGYSARIGREAADQEQVELLKNQAYEAAVSNLVSRYAP